MMPTSLWPKLAEFLLPFAILLMGIGCGKTDQSASTTRPAKVASLVPAATDLLLEMGLADKLVAVSNFDVLRPGQKPLPKVGDYQYTDWEKLAELRPTVLVIQVEPSRLPAEFASRARALGMTLVNVRINRLDDISSAILTLGAAVDEVETARAFQQKLSAQLDAVKQRVAGRPAVRTLLARDEKGVNVIGPNNFLDDLLRLAGGKNVVEGDVAWPSVDAERLVSLNPDVIVQLLPDAPAQLLEQADKVWHDLSQISAVRERRVYVLRQWYALQPGGHVGELAQNLADLLHPASATSGPSAQPAPKP